MNPQWCRVARPGGRRPISSISDDSVRETRGRRLQRRVADIIGEEVIRGDYAPGEFLPTEPELCQRYGVSRTALREAIKSLIAKGLLVSRPRTGTRVLPPAVWGHLDPDVLKWRIAVADTESYLGKMFDLRQATEPVACELAARNGSAEDHSAIEQAFQAMVAAGDDNDLWVDADLTFHKAIYLATGNEFFWPLGELLEFGLAPMFSIAAKGSHRPRAIEEHRELCHAILDRDPQRAKRASLELLRNATGDIERIRSLEDERLNE